TAFSNHAVIGCSISVDALVEQFDADPVAPLQSFVRHRRQIERIIEELVTEERYENDGSIHVRSSDCHWLSDTSHRPIAVASAAPLPA
ncbi:DUF1488 family protein, partial [Acinetobacter baumannii]